MPPLPTEAAPLKVCRRCGSAASPPTEKAMFIHGVGAVGFQNCAQCGARWQYLFSGMSRRMRTSRPAIAAAVTVLLVGVLAVGVVGAMALTRSSDPQQPAGLTSETAPNGGVIDIADAADYVKIVVPANLAAAMLINWLITATSPTVSEIETRVVAFERLARASNLFLSSARWPARAEADVTKLVAANRLFIAEIDRVRHRPRPDRAFTQKLEADAEAVRGAAYVVRSDLALAQT